MATVIEAIKFNGAGAFLDDTVTADQVFTREDLSSAQQMVGRIAADFMRTEVLPREKEIYAKDWPLTRELLRKAGELDLLRVDIPEAYGGLGLDKVSSAYVGEQIGIMPSFAASLGAHTAIGTLPIVYFGNADPRSYGIRYYSLRTPDFPEPRDGSWFAISQVDYLGIQFDAAHRSGYWEAMLARHGAQRVETPGYSIFVFHLGR